MAVMKTKGYWLFLKVGRPFTLSLPKLPAHMSVQERKLIKLASKGVPVNPTIEICYACYRLSQIAMDKHIFHLKMLA